MDFLRNIRLSSLIEKFKYWNDQSNMNNFYNNLPHNSDKAVGISSTEDGYIWFQNGTLTYNNLIDGSTIKLRKTWKESDYTSYCQLQEYGVSSTLFKFDIPVYRKIVEVDGNEVEYIEFQSPVSQHGNNHIQRFINNSKLQDDDLIYLENYISLAAEIFKGAKEISKNNNCGIPIDICKITQFYKGDTNDWIVTESLDWSGNFDDVVQLTLTHLTNFLGRLNKQNPESTIDFSEFIRKAGATWIVI
jgi:hypothetical protein